MIWQENIKHGMYHTKTDSILYLEVVQSRVRGQSLEGLGGVEVFQHELFAFVEKGLRAKAIRQIHDCVDVLPYNVHINVCSSKTVQVKARIPSSAFCDG